MDEPQIAKLLQYIESQSRNKVVFHTDTIPGLGTTDLWVKLGEALYNFEGGKNFSMVASTKLSGLLNDAIASHSVFGRYLAICNLGILFEPELKLSFAQLLAAHSQNNVLFVEWQGEIDADHLYFLSKTKGVRTSIKNLSYITV
jgi:hypothetical protein